MCQCPCLTQAILYKLIISETVIQECFLCIFLWGGCGGSCLKQIRFSGNGPFPYTQDVLFSFTQVTSYTVKKVVAVLATW